MVKVTSNGSSCSKESLESSQNVLVGGQGHARGSVGTSILIDAVAKIAARTRRSFRTHVWGPGMNLRRDEIAILR